MVRLTQSHSSKLSCHQKSTHYRPSKLSIQELQECTCSSNSKPNIKKMSKSRNKYRTRFIPVPWIYLSSTAFTHCCSMSCFFCSSDVGKPLWMWKRCHQKKKSGLITKNKKIVISPTLPPPLPNTPTIVISLRDTQRLTHRWHEYWVHTLTQEQISSAPAKAILTGCFANSNHSQLPQKIPWGKYFEKKGILSTK